MASIDRWPVRLPAEFGHADITPELEKFVSLSLPLIDGKLALGTWQQVVLLDLDTRPRDRTVHVTVLA